MSIFTSKGRTQIKQRSLTKKLLCRVFELTDEALAEQDKKWERYQMQIINPESQNELMKILENPETGDAFKARVISILLALTGAYSPFPWKTHNKTASFFSEFTVKEITSLNLSEKVITFLVGIVIINVETILAGTCDEKNAELLYLYNKIILWGLSILPEGDPRAEVLFECYQINDPIVFWGLDDASGYEPVYHLFCRKNVPDKWKVLAHQKMRGVILFEQNGNKKPRVEHEDALRCYKNIVNLCLYGETSFYGAGLLASQIEFLFELPSQAVGRIFPLYSVGKALKLLEGESFKDLRYRLVKNTILRLGDKLDITINDDYLSAQMMLLELKNVQDASLMETLRGALVAYEEQQVAKQQREVLRKAQEDSALKLLA